MTYNACSCFPCPRADGSCFQSMEVNLHYGDLVDSSNLASIMAKARACEDRRVSHLGWK